MQKILGKIRLVMQEIEYIQKDKRNDFHKYTYASEQAIKEALHPVFAKLGIIFKIDVTEMTRDGQLTTIKLRYAFKDSESEEELAGEFYGIGQDTGDKGLWKAITGAIKYILTSTFLIPTGDDPENDTVSTPTKRVPEKTERAPSKTPNAINTVETPTEPPTAPQSPTEKPRAALCTVCGVAIAPAVAKFSKEQFGTPLCFPCQTRQKRN